MIPSVESAGNYIENLGIQESSAVSAATHSKVRDSMLSLRQLRKASCAMLAMLAVLLLLMNYLASVALGQDKRMYSPPYRWRQSLIIALSRLSMEPTSGYLGHRTIQDYFTDNGLALFSHEPGFDPSAPLRWLQVQADGSALDGLIDNAIKLPIDRALQPVLLLANEIGTVDYFYLSFLMFGPRVSSLFYIYYFILAFSSALFLVQFHRSPPRLFLLCAYAAAHYFMVSVYIPNSYWQLATVHNNRFLSTLGLLPMLHLLCTVLAPKERLTGFALIASVGQASILAFLTLCRLEVAWELFAVMLASIYVALLLLSRRRWSVLQVDRRLKPFFILGLSGFALAFVVIYPHGALDARYANESGTHLFWHGVLVNLIESDHHLYELYRVRPEDGYPTGDDDYIGAVLIEKELTARGDASSPIAYWQDGKVKIHMDYFNGEYDRLLRPLVFKLIFNYPVESVHAVAAPFQQFFTSTLRERGVYSPSNLKVPAAMVLAAFFFLRLCRRCILIKRCYVRMIGFVFFVLFCLSLPSIWIGAFLAVGSITLIVMAFLVGTAAVAMMLLELARQVGVAIATRLATRTR